MMQIQLPPELERFVESQLSGGHYASAVDVVSEGLKLLAELDHSRRDVIAALNADIDRGLASLRDGGAIAGDQVYRELAERRKSYKPN